MGVRGGGRFAKVVLGGVPVLGSSTNNHDNQKAEQW